MYRLRHPMIVLLLFLLAAPAWAYVVVLKDGSQIITRDKYRRDGDRVFLVLQSGVETFIDAAEVDFARTDEVNEEVTGQVVVLGNKVIEETPPPPERDSLRDVAGRTSLSLPEASRRKAADSSSASIPLTRAGFVDLANIPRRLPRDEELSAEMARQLTSQGIENFKVFQGTEDDRLLLEAVVNSESTVFKVLRESAAALVQAQTRFPQRLGALELYMANAQNGRAGQFILTAQLAELLLSGAQEQEMFFYRHVQF